MPTASPIVSESLEEDSAAPVVAAVDSDGAVVNVAAVVVVVAAVVVVAVVVKNAVVVGPVHIELLAFTIDRSASVQVAPFRDTHLVPHH
jgi:hypothetical protein